MAAFSSAGQGRRRPAPVNTSMRRARSGIGVSSEIDMCRSSKPAPNVTPHAWLRKALPSRPLRYPNGFAGDLAAAHTVNCAVSQKGIPYGDAKVLRFGRPIRVDFWLL